MRVDVILSPDSSPGEVTELGLLAERHGIGAVWTSNYPSSRDPFISLCPLAIASSRIRLGPMVVTPYELHPYKTAKALASLNELCGGRANILIGGPTGVNAAMGMGVTRMVGRVRECVEILKSVRPDQPLNYQGKIFQVWGYQPSWATDPPPLIYVGANKPQMLRMAAKVADNIMLGDPTPQSLAAALTTLDHQLQSAGRHRRDVRISALVAWHVKADRKQAVAEARQQLALRGMLDPWYLRGFLSEEECRHVDSHRQAFFTAYKKNTPVIEGVPEPIIGKLVEHLTCTGDARDVDRHIGRLLQFRDMGLNQVALKLHHDQADAIRLIGERVVPALQASAGATSRG